MEGRTLSRKRKHDASKTLTRGKWSNNRAAPIDEDSVELDILDDGADYERIPPQLWHKIRVVATVEGNEDL
jgi:hypothetical protein